MRVHRDLASPTCTKQEVARYRGAVATTHDTSIATVTVTIQTRLLARRQGMKKPFGAANTSSNVRSEGSTHEVNSANHEKHESRRVTPQAGKESSEEGLTCNESAS